MCFCLNVKCYKCKRMGTVKVEWIKGKPRKHVCPYCGRQVKVSIHGGCVSFRLWIQNVKRGDVAKANGLHRCCVANGKRMEKVRRWRDEKNAGFVL